MRKVKFTNTSIARQYVERFPTASKRALARMLMRDHPLVWPSLNAAHCSIRLVTGAMGNLHRRENNMRKDLHNSGSKGFPLLPQGITSFKGWSPVVISDAHRGLILPDVHIPYHDKTALECAIAHGVKRGTDLVILNGDFADFFSVSFWEKDPRKRNLKNEIEMVRQALQHVRGKFPKARIIYKIGNHEERWERYLAVKAPELLGVEDFEITQVLQLANVGIEVVTDKRPIALGQMFVIHGHEFKFGITSPVNPARGFYMRAKENCIGSHLHQSSSHSEKSLAGTIISTWSTGCLCDLHPDYSPLNKWNLGFATVDTDASGLFQVENKQIIDGAIYSV